MKVKETAFERRQRRVRYKLKKINKDKLRLSVFCSNRYIYAQIIDDRSSQTLVSASSLEKPIREVFKAKVNISTSAEIGALIGKRALEKGINSVIFDRGGYAYHGRIKALAESARQSGLNF
jgi:large subunit ribosomal protein L18